MPSQEKNFDSKAISLLKVLNARGKCLTDDCKAFQKNQQADFSTNSKLL